MERKHTLKAFFCDLKNVCVCVFVHGDMLKVIIKKIYL